VLVLVLALMLVLALVLSTAAMVATYCCYLMLLPTAATGAAC